jgi:hypothetical protein
VHEAKRLARAIEDAHDPKLGHDLAHRSAGRVHVVNEGGEPRFIFIDHNAHTTSTEERLAGAPRKTLEEEHVRHKGRAGSAREQSHRRAGPAFEDVVGRPVVLAVLRTRCRVGQSHDTHACAERGLDPRE